MTSAPTQNLPTCPGFRRLSYHISSRAESTAWIADLPLTNLIPVLRPIVECLQGPSLPSAQPRGQYLWAPNVDWLQRVVA